MIPDTQGCNNSKSFNARGGFLTVGTYGEPSRPRVGTKKCAPVTSSPRSALPYEQYRAALAGNCSCIFHYAVPRSESYIRAPECRNVFINIYRRPLSCILMQTQRRPLDRPCIQLYFMCAIFLCARLADVWLSLSASERERVHLEEKFDRVQKDNKCCLRKQK